MPEHDARDLEELLEQIALAARSEHTLISVGDILAAVGTRSFAPLLMLTGTLLISPLSGIPLFPSTMALIVLLVSLQMLFGRRHFWLPQWLQRRTLQRQTLLQILDWLQTPCTVIDRYLRPRLTYFLRGPSQALIALTCLLLALMMPLMELIPFSSSIAGVAICAFGLALVARDGLMVLAAYAMVAMTATALAGVAP